MKCKKCVKRIKKGDKVVLWKTFIQGGEILEEVYFHFKCFLEWRNESLENRAKKLYASSMKAALPKLKGMLGGMIKGINNEEETEENSVFQIGS